MTQPVPPAPVATATRAALRAYLIGLVASVAVAVLPLVQASVGEIHWSAAWWLALGVEVVGPALTAALAYLAHTRYPPA